MGSESVDLQQHAVSGAGAEQGTWVAGRGAARACFSRVFRRSRMKGSFRMRNTPVSMPARNTTLEPLALLPLTWFPVFTL